MERAVNGAFAKTFRSGLAPVEITAALRKEMDTHASPVARDRVLVPNRFFVRMNPDDHAAMTALGSRLMDELSELLAVRAQQRYQMVSPPVITLEPDPRSPLGLLDVRSSSEQVEVAWQPVLEIDGRGHPSAPARSSAAARRRTSPSTTPASAASTSRSCGTAGGRRRATSAPRTARP